ncbi:MAG: hypothetical protein HQL67_01805 [Magnetococcales bacterium]|nr:hypothetical protein [Magnetococcales bacterium]
MDTVEMNTDDYASLVYALQPTGRLGKRDVREGWSTQTADHPEYGPVVLVMDMIKGNGMMIRRSSNTNE